MVKRYCFDIDGIIMNLTPNNDYNLATPIKSNVELINFLYDSGAYIIIYTARGSATGIDWKDVTLAQLKSCGLKYHELIFGKPAADFYIDDKMISLEELKKIIEKYKGDVMIK